MVGREEGEEEGRSLDVGGRRMERVRGGRGGGRRRERREKGGKEEGGSEDGVRLPTRQTSLV